MANMNSLSCHLMHQHYSFNDEFDSMPTLTNFFWFPWTISSSIQTAEYHEYLHLVLEALLQYKLYACSQKYTFHQPEVEFCGHMVGGGVVRVLDKVKVICEWPAPKNVHEVRQCLANYYRRYRL